MIELDWKAKIQIDKCVPIKIIKIRFNKIFPGCDWREFNDDERKYYSDCGR